MNFGSNPPPLISCCRFLATEERKRHTNIHNFVRWLPGWGGSPDQVARGQMFMCCVWKPRNINIFVWVLGREDRWPGGSVTGATEKLFMCQMFICLFWPLEKREEELSGAPRSHKYGCLGDLRITSTSTEMQKRSQNLAPVLVIISGILSECELWRDPNFGSVF